MPLSQHLLFAAVLRNLREKAGWTQGRLEREAGLARGRVSQLEGGDRPYGAGRARTTGESARFCLVERGDRPRYCGGRSDPGPRRTGRRRGGQPVRTAPGRDERRLGAAGGRRPVLRESDPRARRAPVAARPRRGREALAAPSGGARGEAPGAGGLGRKLPDVGNHDPLESMSQPFSLRIAAQRPLGSRSQPFSAQRPDSNPCRRASSAAGSKAGNAAAGRGAARVSARRYGARRRRVDVELDMECSLTRGANRRGRRGRAGSLRQSKVCGA